MLDSLTRAGLAAQITGPVLGPEDEGFAEECAPFNLSVTHHPYVVVGAANSTDVQVAVRFAAQRRLRSPSWPPATRRPSRPTTRSSSPRTAWRGWTSTPQPAPPT
ncbi:MULTISPECIES: hypothetical protein [Streptomyces]|uniref:hypothetical protein n=1 Tax=Streptomyces TaxID=1883 RepID=UPI0029BA97CF|nr:MULTISPECIES: hypothetical protein [unclassified Streptomyces]MDX3088071.1 hypothetical protein [Streptomyces sp. ME12-02E]MDX3331427.1 hypothetical protein [Streptomyces sp. ME02-6978a]WTI31155.1 hypothetical protein OHA67_11445 [Streptomyces jietaisiensis]